MPFRSTSGPTGNVTSTPANPGSILEFTFQPSGARGWDQLIVKKEKSKENLLKVEAYPNPASGYFVLYNYSASPYSLITLTDMNGRIVKRLNSKFAATRIDCTGLAPGIYLILVRDELGKKEGTARIVIQ